MHALVHILSRTPLTYADVEQIMDPYYEGNVYRYDEGEDENQEYTEFNGQYARIKPKTVIHPQFTWDYYSIHDPIMYHSIIDCYVLIDPDGWCIARKWWNGQKWIDQTFDFENYIHEHRQEWEGQVYMIEADIHW